jgi:hypothetical protein
MQLNRWYLNCIFGRNDLLAIGEFDSISGDGSFSVGDVDLEARIHVSQFLKANAQRHHEQKILCKLLQTHTRCECTRLKKTFPSACSLLFGQQEPHVENTRHHKLRVTEMHLHSAPINAYS